MLNNHVQKLYMLHNLYNINSKINVLEKYVFINTHLNGSKNTDVVYEKHF